MTISYRKRYRLDKPKIQYQAYRDINQCHNANDLNIAIKRYFYGFLEEVNYGKYYGDIIYNSNLQQFQLSQYTFEYSQPINVPYQYVKSLYLQMIFNWLPKGYYKYRKQK